MFNSIEKAHIYPINQGNKYIAPMKLNILTNIDMRDTCKNICTDTVYTYNFV